MAAYSLQLYCPITSRETEMTTRVEPPQERLAVSSSFLDNVSRMTETPSAVPVNERIAANVRATRSRLGLSLDSLAAASGVSRSALSLIERAESSPTAVVLDKVAAGLGVPLASLFGGAASADGAQPLARRGDQPEWRDPDSGYVRRSVSPPGDASPIQIVEVTFPAGARVAFETAAGERAVHQQLWVLEGTIDFTIGSDSHRLEAGDCLAARLDRPTMFHNPGASVARYAVVVTEPLARRP
jgi:transcriptional regulator with XRE-family HTH domain